ncbi:uncharacterized protein [Antedon mediterranea]|uniref:uncharacterized protein n=1 Tax=Antedon mediterranea TaxID=105859 RepID=UPI003AF8153E
MSIPLWKQTILERKEKKKEEEKRKAAEAEQRRLDALPPWKRVIEERNVIIISADKTEVGLGLEVKKSDRKVAEKIKDHLKKEKNDDGVSEEHCTSVGDNPFLKLDKNRSHKTQNSRNVGASTSKTTRPEGHGIKINKTGVTFIQQSTKPDVAATSFTSTQKKTEHNVPVLSENNESVKQNDFVDKQQLSVSELLGRFKYSSQENLLDVGITSPPRQSRSTSTNKTSRSKSLDRNTAKKVDNISHSVHCLPTAAKASPSFPHSKQVLSTPKVTEKDNLHSALINSEYDILTRKKNKPDLSASELIDLGADAPISPLSTLSPFNFEIIESARIQRKIKADKNEIAETEKGDINTNLGNKNYSVSTQKYKNEHVTQKKGNKKEDVSVDTNSFRNNDNLKKSVLGMPSTHTVQDLSPVPPPRNKKKKKAPKLEEAVMKKESHKENSANEKTFSIKSVPQQQNLKKENKVHLVIGDVKTKQVGVKSEVSAAKENHISLNDKDDLPVSNIDDILLSPVKREVGEELETYKRKSDDKLVNLSDGEKKKGVVKKITSVEFVGENEFTGNLSILKSVDGNHAIKSKKSVTFNQQLSETFDYASEAAANLFFDEIESVGSTENENLKDSSDVKLTDEVTDNINEDDEIEHKSVDDGLKSNTSIGNKGLQAYVPNYLQNAYMSTIERRRNQDEPQTIPVKGIIENEPIEAEPESTSNIFSGWSSGNSAMLF